MRILFITHYDNMYGANRALCKLIRLLKTQYGHEPMLVIPSEGEMTDSLSDIQIPYMVSGVTQWQAEYTTPLRFFVKKTLRKKKIREEVAAIYEKFKDEKIDLIHSNSSVIGHGAMLAEMFGCTHVWHIREFSKEHFSMRYFYDNTFVKNAYENAGGLICISDSLKDNYKNKYPKARLFRVYDGVSPADTDSDTGTNSHASDMPGKSETVFVYTGYLFSKKHQDTVIEAAAMLRERGITDYKILFAGDGKKEYREYLQNMIDTKGLDNVKLLGYVSDVNALLDTADVGIIASEYEGFGLVTVEYMLHSLPVIGYNSGATPEIVDNGQTGYIYTETSELADIMSRFIEDKNMACKMGTKGRKRAAECFSEEKNAAGIMEVYGEIFKNE